MKLTKKALHEIFAEMGFTKGRDYRINERLGNGFCCSFAARCSYNGSPDYVPVVEANEMVWNNGPKHGLKVSTMGVGYDYNARMHTNNIQPKEIQ